MRLPLTCSIIAPVLITLIAMPAVAADNYVETWDDGDTAYWLGGSAWTTVVVEDTGGNPGGFIRATAQEPNPFYGGIMTDKPQFCGNFDVAGVTSISADVKLVTGTVLVGYFRLRFSGETNGWGYSIPGDQITTSWTNFSAPIDPTWSDAEAEANGWLREGDTVPSWQDTNAHVFTVSFRAFTSPESTEFEMGYDNFMINATAPPCPADISDDGFVNADDLAALLAAWGPCPSFGYCIEDLDDDGTVGASDLAILLATWGACPAPVE